MNRNKRFMAGAAALVVAAVGFTGLQGLASAYTATPGSGLGIPCHLYFGAGLPGTPAGDASLQQSNSFLEISELRTYNDAAYTIPDTAFNAGETVYVRLVAPDGFKLGPVGVAAGAVNATTAEVSATIGGVSTPLTLGLGGVNYPLTNKTPGSLTGTLTLKTSFTAAGNGTSVLALERLISLTDDGGGGTVDNYCDGTSAGTTLPPSTLSTSGATTWTSSNFVSGVAGFRGTRVAPGTVTWEVPPAWTPQFAPVTSSTITETLSITGPNAAVSSVGGQTAGVTGYVREASSSSGTAGTINLTGTVWGLSKVSTDFVAELCNVGLNTCDAPLGVSTLATDGSGNLTGSVRVKSGIAATTGSRVLRLTEGTNVSTTPIVVLGQASISISPANGGPGTTVTVTGSSFDPLAATSVYGGIPNPNGICNVADGPTPGPPCNDPVGNFPVGPYVNTTPANAVTAATSLSNGNLSTTAVVSQPTTQKIVAAQTGATNSAIATFTISLDQCIAYTGDLTGGAGCATKQNVNVSVLQGNLTQRVYVNSAAATGTGVADGSATTTPVVGTSNVNNDNTTVNLGTITTPLAPAVISGTLNDITVSDNRGGTNGWSLTATGSGFTGVPSGTIAASALTATPSCAAATNSTAWDYSNAGKVAITGFDATLNAGGVTAGSAAQAFGSTVNLCTKDTAVNGTTGSTGGVYNVTSSLSLTVPAFQKAARYTALVTITLA